MAYSKYIDKTKDEKAFNDIIQRYVGVITATMGPGGRSVLIQGGMKNEATWDGVTVARNLVPRDPVEALVTAMIVDAANRTVKQAGDGTTSTAALLAAIYEIYASVFAEVSIDRRAYLKGIDNAVNAVVDQLAKNSRPIVKDGEIDLEALRHVAVIACNGNKDYGYMVADLIADVGANGRVVLKENVGNVTYTESEIGYTFATKIMGREMLREKDPEEIILENPYFILNADILETLEEVQMVIDTWLESSEMRTNEGKVRPLVIISTGLVGAARSFIAGNANSYPIYVIQTPLGGGERGFDILEDIQGITGTHQVFVKSSGKYIKLAFGADFTAEDEISEHEYYKEFGQASKVILTQNKCSILPGRDNHGAPYDPMPRINRLKMRIKASQDEHEIDFLHQRIAALDSGVGVIYVGGESDTAVTKIKASLDDAQRACFAAISKGVLPGCGCALLHAIEMVGNEAEEEAYNNLPTEQGVLNGDQSYWAGYLTLLNACFVINETVLSNHSRHPVNSVEILEGKDKWSGMEADGSFVEDMYIKGIIDPTLVVERALVNAASIAKEFIDCKYMLVEDVKKIAPDGGSAYDEQDDLPDVINKQSIRDLYKKMEWLTNKKHNG